MKEAKCLFSSGTYVCKGCRGVHGVICFSVTGASLEKLVPSPWYTQDTEKCVSKIRLKVGPQGPCKAAEKISLMALGKISSRDTIVSDIKYHLLGLLPESFLVESLTEYGLQ